MNLEPGCEYSLGYEGWLLAHFRTEGHTDMQPGVRRKRGTCFEGHGFNQV